MMHRWQILAVIYYVWMYFLHLNTTSVFPPYKTPGLFPAHPLNPIRRQSHLQALESNSLIYVINVHLYIMQSTTSVAAVGLRLTGALLRSLIIVYIHQMIIFGIRKLIFIYGVCNELWWWYACRGGFRHFEVRGESWQLGGLEGRYKPLQWICRGEAIWLQFKDMTRN